MPRPRSKSCALFFLATLARLTLPYCRLPVRLIGLTCWCWKRPTVTAATRDAGSVARSCVRWSRGLCRTGEWCWCRLFLSAVPRNCSTNWKKSFTAIGTGRPVRVCPGTNWRSLSIHLWPAVLPRSTVSFALIGMQKPGVRWGPAAIR